MIFNEFLLVVAAFTITIVDSSNSVMLEQDSNLSLLNFMSRSNDLMKRNPLRSTECFSYYIPLIDDISKKYRDDFEACLEESNKGRSAAETDTFDERNELVSRANSSCELLSKCQYIESAENVFECFIEGGSTNIKTMYEINSNASESLSTFQEKLRLIVFTEYRCTNDTKRAYETDSAKAYDDLNKCILGISKVPTTTTTQATVQTTSSAIPQASHENLKDSEKQESPDMISPEEQLPEEDINYFSI